MDKGALDGLLSHSDSPAANDDDSPKGAAQSSGGCGEDESRAMARKGTVTVQMLRDHFHLPLHTVAKKFGMCTTAFKKMCRRMDIPKWPHRQLRGIDKKIAALKTELNYATNADRQQFIAGLSSLETEKTRLSQGIFSNLTEEAEEANDSGSDSRSRSPNTDAEADTTPPPGAPESAAVEGDADTDSDGTIDDEPARTSDADLQQISNVVVTEKELREHFHLPLHTVAKKFGMCTTAFKKLCRRFAIAKWPHRQLRGIDKKIAALRAALNYSTGDKDACWANLRKLEEEKARIARTGPEREDGEGSSPAGSSQPPGSFPARKESPIKEEEEGRGGAGETRASSRADISNLLCDDDDDDDDDEAEAGTPNEGGDGRSTEETMWMGGAITEDLLREHFHLPLQVVAKKFGMCTTAFKKLCRRFAIAKWPHRQLRGIDKKIAALRAALNYSTGDRHTCQRSIVALEEEKARLTQAALGDKPAPSTGASPRTLASSTAHPPPLDPRSPRSPPLGGSAPKKRKAEEGSGRAAAEKRRREVGDSDGEGKRKASKGGEGEERGRGLAAIDMLVSAADEGMREELARERAASEGWAHAALAHPAATAPMADGGAMSRALSLGGLGGATPFNTPPLDPVSPLLPVPVAAAAAVPPLCSGPLQARPVLPMSQWAVGPGPGAGGLGLGLAPGGVLTSGALGLPQPSWGIAAPGGRRLL